jgi:hypothetical protein
LKLLTLEIFCLDLQIRHLHLHLVPAYACQVTRSRTFFVASIVLTSIVHSMCSCMSTKTARL